MKKICLISFLFLVFSCSKHDKVEIKILSYTGNVTVNTSPVKGINMALKEGDSIETTGKSSCEIIINEKNILRLQSDTKLVLNISEKGGILLLEKGWMAGVTKKVFTKDGRFIVKMPTVTASIRGTSFCLKVENEKSSYFCTCNGTIELTGADKNKSEQVEAAHHSGRRFSIDNSGALIEDYNPGLLYHSDEGIEEMAQIIDETVDWSKPDRH